MKLSGIKNDLSFESKEIWVSRFNIELWAKLHVLKLCKVLDNIQIVLAVSVTKKGYWIYVRKNISLRPPSKFAIFVHGAPYALGHTNQLFSELKKIYYEIFWNKEWSFIWVQEDLSIQIQYWIMGKIACPKTYGALCTDLDNIQIALWA